MQISSQLLSQTSAADRKHKNKHAFITKEKLKNAYYLDFMHRNF